MMIGEGGEAASDDHEFLEREFGDACWGGLPEVQKQRC